MVCKRAMHTIRSERRRTSVAIFLLVLFGASPALALEIDDLRITRDGRVYKVQITFDVAAPTNKVMAVLKDNRFPDRLNPKVTNREVISQQGALTRVRTEVYSCVLFFCKEVVMTLDVSVVADTIQSDIVPDKSDFRYGHMRWVVTSNEANGSHIVFEAVIEPDFFIPPVIGGFFARKKLRQETMVTVANLETESALEVVPDTKTSVVESAAVL